MSILTKVKKTLHQNRESKACFNADRDPKTWVFGEWFGNRCCDNSMYLANYVAENDKNIKTYFITKDSTDCANLSSKVCRLTMDSEEAMIVLKKAAVGFSSHDLHDFSESGIHYLNGGLHVSLYHGVMWKYIGLDIYKNKLAPEYLAELYMLRTGKPDVVLTPSEKYKENYDSAYRTGNKLHIAAGLPRNRAFTDPELLKDITATVRGKLQKEFGIVNPNTRIIVYLPTFRDAAGAMDVFQLLSGEKEFLDYLEKEDICLINKGHYATEQRGETKEDTLNRFIKTEKFSAQELMAVADMLITDYSSCFFDYLHLDRPIIHFLYDYDYYLNSDRGLYYVKEDVIAGSDPASVPDLIGAIRENMENPMLYHDLRCRRKGKYITYDTAESCAIIVRKVKEVLNK